MSKPAKGEMTIHELAERTGMTVRNIRAHQTRGLLPPPVVRGRTGYYNADHVARIALTRELQADGLNLEAIRRVLAGGGDHSATQIFDFTRAVRAPFEEEAPEIVKRAELAGIWQEAMDEDKEAELIARVEKLGVLRALPEEQFEVISPRMFRAAAALGALGVGPEEAVVVAEKLRRHVDGAARTLVELFVKAIWVPFERAGRPEADWPKVREALDRLRPFTSEALLGAFQLAMDDAVDRATEQAFRRATVGAKSRRKRSSAR
jgi:DNA-binding transcriptional MerR regulator